MKALRKNHGLGKGISSLLGNFDYDLNSEEVIAEAEKWKNEVVEELLEEKPGHKIKLQDVKIDEKPAVSSASVDTQSSDSVLSVPISDIEANENQPRSERRYRAAKLAGLEKVPVLVRQLSELQRIEVALIENIQREDLNPVDEAVAYQFLIQKSGFTQDEIAKRVGKNRSTITNSLRLLQLPDSMKDDLISGVITPGHARAILSCVNPSDRILLRNKIVEKELSVRAAEAEAEALNQGKKLVLKKKGSGKPKDMQIQEVEDKLLDAFGTRVEVKGNLKRGKLIIPYTSTIELERLYSLVKDDSLFDEE